MSTQRFKRTNIISGIPSKIKGNYKKENKNCQNNGESSKLQEEYSIASKRMFHIWINTHIPTVDEPSPIFFNTLLDLHLKPTLKYSYSHVCKLIKFS